MENLKISGNTNELSNWDINEVIQPIRSKDYDIARILEYEYDNTIGKYTGGLTYLEVEQFNNTYNNFR
jgi:hypothetical protein